MALPNENIVQIFTNLKIFTSTNGFSTTIGEFRVDIPEAKNNTISLPQVSLKKIYE